jgi:prepilin-type N-terminal cleavage/methylation domain-containing protein
MIQTSSRHSSEGGFSLVEMMFVVGVMGVLTGMAVLQIGNARPALRGDGGMRVVLSQMNQAREAAITQRRNMRLTFTNGNQVQISREEIPGGGLTVISTVLFEGGARFGRISGLPDTPDQFGNSNDVNFGVATEVKFSAEGKLINQNGASINGTVFVSLPNQPLSARAVTVLGSTGRVRGFKWDGRIWKLV